MGTDFLKTKLPPVRCIMVLLAAILLFATGSQPLNARQPARIVPQIRFTGTFDWSKTVYVEVSVTDGTTKINVMKTIQPGQPRTVNFVLEGVAKGKNYILTARAGNDRLGTQSDSDSHILRALIRKERLEDLPEDGLVVAVNAASTIVADAVLLFMDNTLKGLNDPLTDSVLEAIETAADPIAEAIRLSTTTEIRGTVCDIHMRPLEGVTVLVAGSTPLRYTLTDASGHYSLPSVPVKYTQIQVEAAPRYISRIIGPLVLIVGVPTDTDDITLEPDPSQIRVDLQTITALMVDDPTGDLPGWLAADFVFAMAGHDPLDKNEFIAGATGRFAEMRHETGYSQTHNTGYVYHFTCTDWQIRETDDLSRTRYQAQGDVEYSDGRWKLSGLTLTQPQKLPLPPAGLQTTGLDGQVNLTWTVSADSVVTGYQITRTETADPPPADAEPIHTGLLPRSQNSFSHTKVLSGTYYYWIRCVETFEGHTVYGEWSNPVSAQVFSSESLLQIFVDYAVQRDTVNMLALLDSGFIYVTPSGYESTDKNAFVDWICNQFTVTAPYTATWQLSMDTVSKSFVDDGVLLQLRAYLVGTEVNNPGKNRWSESNERWRIRSSTQKIAYFRPGAREFHPDSPDDFRCTNAATVLTDGFAVLVWERPIDPELAGYILYRNDTSSFATAQRMNGSLLGADQLTYTDSGIVGGRTYYYWIVAEDSYGKQSPAGAPIVVGLPAEVATASQTFMEATFNKNGNAVKSVAVTSFQYYFNTTLGGDLNHYCQFDGFEPTSFVLKDFALDEGRYRVTYTVQCKWHGISYNRVTLELIQTDQGWKVKDASFLTI